MSDYWQIAYFDPQPPRDISALPVQIKGVLDWTWNQTAVARWIIGNVDDPQATMTSNVKLAIFNWQANSENRLTRAFTDIRSSRPSLPILAVIPNRMRTPLWERTVNNDPHTVSVKLGNIEKEGIQAVLDALGVYLPPPKILLRFVPGDFSVNELVTLLGHEDRLRLALEKFFPDARSADVRSVGGGWSGSKLCIVFIEGDDQPYFLKFFHRRDEYQSELTKHQEAQKWLKDKLVRLHLIPELGRDVSNQTQAFPETAPGEIRGIVCYESASTWSCPRCTLKHVYQNHDEARVTEGIQECLNVLASKQNPQCVPETLWQNNRFALNHKARATILAVMHDLTPYGPAICSEWRQCCQAVEKLIHDDLPDWLKERIPVMLGHTHGDPNPRNCLVLPHDCTNFRFIDIGGYTPQGRLVSDLAIIERDIKLVLMGIEAAAHDYHDLNVMDMRNWHHAERDAIARGIDYQRHHAPPRSKAHSPACQAYEQVALVRQRAKVLSGSGDPEGKHYFAALLFWTLDILKYEAVRPTKKLLAVCSAAEILQRF